MTAFRQILKDRVAAYAMMLIVGQFLLAQAFLASFTCSAMAGAVLADTGMGADAPATVICHRGASSVADAADRPLHQGGSGGMCRDCPCGIACAGAVALPAEGTPGADLGPAFRLRSDAIPVNGMEAAGCPAPPPITLRPAPTGPPILRA